MRAAIRDFPGTSFASGLVKKMTESENLPEYKTAMRKWSKVVSTERESEEKYLSYIEMIANSGSVPDSAALWFAIEIRSLNRMRDKGSPENSQMASRVMNFMSILCSEQGSSFYRNKLYAQAGLMYEICTLSDSQNPNNYYNLARSLAQSSKPKKAVDALTDAVDHGFNSLKTIESDPAFRQIRSENRYKALIGRIK
jgi:hypothetical protein